MLISYRRTTTSTGSTVFADIVLSTYEIAIRGFELDLGFTAQVQEIVGVALHPALTEEYGVSVVRTSVPHQKISIAYLSTQPFKTAADGVVVASVLYRIAPITDPGISFQPMTRLHLAFESMALASIRVLENCEHDDLYAHMSIN